MNNERALHAALTTAMADLEQGRLGCLAVLADQLAMPVDKVKASSELRLIGKAKLELIDRIIDAEGSAYVWTA